MRKNWLLVGSIGKPHGIKGWLKINSYTEPTTNILLYQPWHLTKSENNDSFHSIEIEDYQVYHQHLLVQFADCLTPEAARLLTHHKIYVERYKLAPLSETEYYWADLEGLKVYNDDNIYLGVVQTLLATGANDVLIVEGEKRYLIPFLLDNTIKSIDLEQQKMIVAWDANF
jgi:16S rRNA processing protein RimM